MFIKADLKPYYGDFGIVEHSFNNKLIQNLHMLFVGVYKKVCVTDTDLSFRCGLNHGKKPGQHMAVIQKKNK